MEELLRETSAAETEHFWYRGFRRFVAPSLAGALTGRTDARILDAGCGTGRNLELLDPSGHTFGFDVTWAGLALARRAGRRRVVCARAGAAPFPDATFDVVTSFDVLYCLDDEEEQAAIGEMFRLLRPGGTAIINVAAMDILKGNHSVFDGEIRRYSRPGLRTKLERAGFEVARLTHTNASLFLPMLVIRQWQQWRGLEAPGEALSDFARLPTPLNAALAALLTAEAAVVRRVDLPFGSSILCLARKPEA